MDFDATLEATESIKDCRRGLKSVTLLSASTGRAVVSMDTIEGHTWQVAVSTGGWVVLNEDTEEVFETLHSLLLHRSPGYKQAFDAALLSQLEQLAKMQDSGQ
jgi:hypothetical protein